MVASGGRECAKWNALVNQWCYTAIAMCKERDKLKMQVGVKCPDIPVGTEFSQPLFQPEAREFREVRCRIFVRDSHVRREYQVARRIFCSIRVNKDVDDEIVADPDVDVGLLLESWHFQKVPLHNGNDLWEVANVIKNHDYL